MNKILLSLVLLGLFSFNLAQVGIENDSIGTLDTTNFEDFTILAEEGYENFEEGLLEENQEGFEEEEEIGETENEESIIEEEEEIITEEEYQEEQETEVEEEHEFVWEEEGYEEEEEHTENEKGKISIGLDIDIDPTANTDVEVIIDIKIGDKWYEYHEDGDGKLDIEKVWEDKPTPGDDKGDCRFRHSCKN